MSFFKDLKEDIAQSVNELTESMDEGLSMGTEAGADDLVEKTAVSEEEPLVAKSPQEELLTSGRTEAGGFDELAEEIPINDMSDDVPMTAERARALLSGGMSMDDLMPEPEEPPVQEAPMPEEAAVEEPEPVQAVEEPEPEPESEPEPEIPVPEEPVAETPEPENNNPEEENIVNDDKEIEVTDTEELNPEEVTVITKGTTINGGIRSDTSLIVKGTIEGDVECQGKLTITGRVAGNTIASEIYVNTPRLEGDINSKGIVKIDVGTVVIGNVNCTSVVVAGAVKGNIEVNGPVVIDTTAVVKGNVSAKSIQINSGAVIDGHCSLQFADVDLDTFFE